MNIVLVGGIHWFRWASVIAAPVICAALAGCVKTLSRQELDRATGLAQGGNDAAAEATLKGLVAANQSGAKLLPDEEILVRSRLIPILENQGRLGEALEIAQQVHAQLVRMRGERAPNSIAALGNLGRLYSSIGRVRQAVDAQEKSMRMSIEVMGPWHETSIASRINLAATYVKVGRTREAIRLQEAALDATRRTSGAEHPRTLLAQSNLSKSYLMAGSVEEAMSAAYSAQAGLRRVLGATNPATLVALSNYARVLTIRGNHAEASAVFESLVSSSAQVWGERHRFTLDHLSGLARSSVQLGRSEKAVLISPRFIDGAEHVRAQPGLARDDRRAMFASYADDYRFFSALHGSAGQLSEGFRLAELSKARTLLEAMSEQTASRSGVLPVAEQDRLREFEQRIVQHEQAISEAADPRQRADLVVRRDSDLREYERKVSSLKAKFPRFAELRDPRIVTTNDIPSIVPSGSIFVGYLIRGDRLYAWLGENSGQVTFRDLGVVHALADSIEVLRRASSMRGGVRDLLSIESLRAWKLAGGGYRLIDASLQPPPGSVPLRSESEVAAYLSDRLLRPLAVSLRGRSQWIVSPDGALARLPFELLEIDGRRVLESVDVHYAQSLSVYALVQARQRTYRSIERPKDLLAIGNPVYEADAESGASRGEKHRSTPILSEHQLKELRHAWVPLPGTEREVNALLRLLPNGDALLKQQASEAVFQSHQERGALKDYRYLHFAVHGYLSPDNPALSSVVLSQTNLSPGTDGYITASEWPAYDLRSDLTVLSACDTGLGANLSGEGVMGLPYALFVAGNVNTILTLWPVVDDVAPILMEEMFSRLKGGVPASLALTQAKRVVASNPKTRHPSNWAPFILVGAG